MHHRSVFIHVLINHRTYYKLHNDLVQMQDYLTCEMTALIGSSTKNLEDYMDQEMLDSFNNAVSGIYAELATKCPRWNCVYGVMRAVECLLACASSPNAMSVVFSMANHISATGLNYTNIAPSKRDPQCVLGSPTTVSQCPPNTPYDKNNLIPCSWIDSSGGTWEGVCDPNQHWYGGTHACLHTWNHALTMPKHVVWPFRFCQACRPSPPCSSTQRPFPQLFDRSNLPVSHL